LNGQLTKAPTLLRAVAAVLPADVLHSFVKNGLATPISALVSRLEETPAACYAAFSAACAPDVGAQGANVCLAEHSRKDGKIHTRV